MSTGTEG